MLANYARFITRHALWVLLAVAGLTALAALQLVDVNAIREGRWKDASRLTVDASIDSMLPTDDDDRRYYDRIRRMFGNDDSVILVGHREGGIYDTGFLGALQGLSERAKRVSGVRTVLSLANVPNVRSADGELEVGSFYEEPPTDPAELARIRREVEANPTIADAIVSKDGKSALVAVLLRDMSSNEFMRKGIDAELRAIADEEFAGHGEVWLTGSAHIKAETVRTLLSDLTWIIPAASLLMSIIAFLTLRSIRGVLIPLAGIGIAVVWMLGVAALWNPQLNILSASTPAMLLVVGFAYSIHGIATYYEAVEEKHNTGASWLGAERGLEMVVLPNLLAGVSTAIGLFSLVTNPLLAIRQFGLLCGCGVLAAMTVSITFAPALLALLREQAPKPKQSSESPVDHWFGRIGAWDVANRRTIFGVAAVLTVISLVAIPRIEVGTDLGDSFGPETQVRQSLDKVIEAFGIGDQISVILEAPYKDAFKEPANLAVMQELQAWLGEQPEVSGSVSLVDHVMLVNRVFHDDDASFHRIPETKRLVSQLLLFGASNETKRFVDSQYQVAHLLVRVKSGRSSAVSALVARVEERLTQLPEHLSGRPTGNTVLVAKTSDEIAVGQALGVFSAFLGVFAIMAPIFMSLWIGFLAMVPNMIPVVVYFGILGWTGVTLNTVTGIVASLVIGVSVDDTIHFLSRFQRLAKERANEKAAVVDTVKQLARPVAATTAALCFGFGILGFSTLKQNADFGVLAAVTLGFAWLTDVFMTPALAAGMRIVTLWDVLTLDLGSNPQHEIPLFRGLSSRQAKVAALMCDLVMLPAGHRVVQNEDRADAMYLVVDGQLRSSVEQDAGGRLELNTHERGDVFGEVGLLHGRRTADVDALSPVRLLRLEPDDLQRLQRRYPRIGAKVFLNLSEILAGRLARLTMRVG